VRRRIRPEGCLALTFLDIPSPQLATHPLLIPLVIKCLLSRQLTSSSSSTSAVTLGYHALLYAQEQAINTPSQPIPRLQIDSSFPSCRNAAAPSTRSSYILAMPRLTHEHHLQADHRQENIVPRHRAEQARGMGLIPWMVSSIAGYRTMVCLPSHTHTSYNN
jgi:hypothetical protein